MSDLTVRFSLSHVIIFLVMAFFFLKKTLTFLVKLV